jgi:hypothetical protein
MKLRARLQKLERTVGIDGGCPACRQRRGLSVTVFSEENDDGTITEPEGMPTPCERCGEIPEQIFHVIETVVKDTEDVFAKVAEVKTGVPLK